MAATRHLASVVVAGVQGAMLYRLLCTYAPSQLLSVVIAGVGTFVGGLQFAVVFLVALAVYRLGNLLDNYSMERHDT